MNIKYMHAMKMEITKKKDKLLNCKEKSNYCVRQLKNDPQCSDCMPFKIDISNNLA